MPGSYATSRLDRGDPALPVVSPGFAGVVRDPLPYDALNAGCWPGASG
jgi:hypothetical protein